jgi:transposase
VILAHKSALDPPQTQAAYFARAAGTARFAWNWALARGRQECALGREYRCGPKPAAVALRRALNAVTSDAFPGMGEVTKNAPQQAIKNLGTAFQTFLEGRAKEPPFQKKAVSRASFRADPGTDKRHPNAVKAEGKRVKLPVIGWVRMREALRFKGQIKSATVSRVADRGFPSSRMCSDCKHIHAGLTLADREWTCEACGTVHDRDHNAATNLRDFAASSAVTACGADRSRLGLAAKVNRAAVKQEPTLGTVVPGQENGAHPLAAASPEVPAEPARQRHGGAGPS